MRTLDRDEAAEIEWDMHVGEWRRALAKGDELHGAYRTAEAWALTADHRDAGAVRKEVLAIEGIDESVISLALDCIDEDYSDVCKAAAKWLFAKLDPHTQRAMEAAYADWACDAAPIEVHQIVEDRGTEEMLRRVA